MAEEVEHMNNASAKFRRPQVFGPGLWVTAAFIGPGTVTTASLAGARFGYELLWAVTFSVIATVVLQEMAARVGLVTRAGLGDALRSTFDSKSARFFLIAAVVFAIGGGNAAYQAGNLLGASVALELVTPIAARGWLIVLGSVAFVLMFWGGYRGVSRVLVGFVLGMSLLFVVAAVAARPETSVLMRGAIWPSFPAGSAATIIGLIGTTIVPYNLFLHASSVAAHWPASIETRVALRSVRIDTLVSVAIGGLITAAIVTTAAATVGGGEVEIKSAAEMAKQLEPTLGGGWAKVAFAIGLFAAGMSSAITAPLAAAYAITGVCGWPASLQDSRFRGIWMGVLACGLLAAAWAGGSPTQAILMAQIANGILLPAIVVFLLIAVNRRSLMQVHANGVWANLAGIVVVVLVAGLSAWTLYEKLRTL